MICKHCGTEVKDDATFCPFCGKPTKDAETKIPSYCPKCAAPTVEGAAFCVNCGEPLQAEKLDPYAPKKTVDYYAPAPKKSTGSERVLGILSIVFAFLMPFVGFVLGIIAIVGGNKSGDTSARTMGIVGLILSIVLTVLSIFAIVGLVALFVNTPELMPDSIFA